MKFKIKKADHGVRLDKFLASKLEGKTRGMVQKIIESGTVLVDSEVKTNHYALKEGEVVDISKAVKKEKVVDANTVPEVIYENDEFIVVNKPSGLIVHGAPHIKQTTLADWLLKKYPKLKNIGEDKTRPGIMHRLDKDASGLLVIAKTNDSFASLKKQFQKRLIEKEYTALAYGAVVKDEDKIDFSLKRAAGGHRQAAVPDGYNFKENFLELREAFTSFKVVKRFINYTLLAVKITSGRKHQIRVHFFAYGYPLVGDDLYSTKRTREGNRKNNLGRIFLVATKLSFADLSGKKHTFSIKLPHDLEDFLKIIK